MSKKSKAFVTVAVLVAFVAGVFFTTAGANLFGGNSPLTESHAGDTRIDGGEASSPADFQDAFTKVAEAVNPTVVQVRSSRVSEQQQQRNPFEDFFGNPRRPEGERRAQGLGSGVFVRSGGYIVTNYHVVQKADQLTVVTYDGSEYDAEMVGKDKFSDLAVIRVKADKDFPTISFADAGEVKVGQWVLAFGSPLSADLENTVTAGIVSAVGRTSQKLARLNLASELIQTDASINQGNSGGPLVNLNGEMIGVNNAIFSRSGGSVGIGFAIPANIVKNVSQQLIEGGNVRRGALGVRFDQVSETYAEALGVPRGAAQVIKIYPGSPAKEAGLKQGDVIVAINGEQLSNHNQLRTIIGNKRPGDEVEMKVVNEGGEKRTVTITLANRSEMSFASDQPRNQQNGGGRGDSAPSQQQLEDLGLELQNATPRVLQQLGLNPEQYQGVFVSGIDRGSMAYRDAELRERDLIVGVNGQRVRNQSEFTEVFEQIESGATFLLRVVRARGGQARSFNTALRKPSS